MSVKFTDLEQATQAYLTDIIAAVQGYTDPDNLGESVQMTLAQVLALSLANTVAYYSGDPNGFVAGNTYQFCWDTLDSILYICTATGTSSTAIWTSINSAPSSPSFISVSASSVQMVINTTYQANSASLVTLTLPVLAAVGTTVAVVGYGTGLFLIAQNSGQQIRLSSGASTVGVSGSISSLNQYDGVVLTCTVANTVWQAISGAQGVLTIT